MVIESLIKPKWVIKQPLYALYLGICLSLIGTSIGLFIFPEDASLAGILFTTIAATPFLVKIIDYTKERAKGTWVQKFWSRNRQIAAIYGLFFLGVAFSYIIWYLILPAAASAFFFNKQLTVLTQPTSFLGYFSQAEATLLAIVSNNLKLVLVCLVLSIIYGMGATLIITWNASVLGVFIASFGKLANFAAYIPHTTMEFIAFFFAAMAGGLLSIAFNEEKTKWGSVKFNKVIFDASMLFIFSIVLVFVAAFIEVYGLIA